MHDYGNSNAADPNGKHFSGRLVSLVCAKLTFGSDEKRFATKRATTHQEAITPAMQAYNRGHYEAAERFDDQDRERRKLGERMDRENILWRNPDGSPTPEAIEYAELSLRQVRGNTDRFIANTKLRGSRGDR
jgi:hypothetical protein